MTLYFRVADLCFSVESADGRDLRPLMSNYAPFYLRQQPAEDELVMRLRVGEGLVDGEPEGEEIGQFDVGGSNHGVFRIEGGYKFQLRTPGGVLACAMRCRDSFRSVEASISGTEGEQAYGLNNALMISFTYAAVASDAVLIHSSVTTYKGRGYLFLGVSGTGKSTHSQQWLRYIEGTELLNDDNPVLRAFPDGRAIVYGSPWSGKTPCYRNRSCPIGAFVSLEQYPGNEIEACNTLRAFAAVFSSCSTMIWDEPSQARVIKTVSDIVGRTKTYHLRCRPDEEAALLCCRTVAATQSADA